jgi:hypothetical protein
MSTKSRSTSTPTQEKKDTKDKRDKKHKKGETSADGIQSKATRKKKQPSKTIRTKEVPDSAILAIGEENKQTRLTTSREIEEHLKRVLDGADTLIAPVSSEKNNKTKRGNSKERRRRKQRGDDEEAKPPKSPSKTVRKEEEARKRREPLMVSPFDYLQVKHFEPPLDDCSVFPDDISHLTLPKQLQELEKKHHHDDMPSLLQILEKEQPAPYPSSKVASLLGGGLSPEVQPNPGWSRKSQSRSSSRSTSFESSIVDETPRAAASTQYRSIHCHSFDVSHTHHPSPS